MKQRLLRFMGVIGTGLLLAYVVLVIVMYSFQRSLLYMPLAEMNLPAQYGLMDFREIKLASGDGVRVKLWVHEPKHGQPLIIYYHGNGGNLFNRADKLRHFVSAGAGVVALSYRGYGGSEGTPTEQGIYQDARAAIHYATHDLKLPLSRIIVYGESLGTGVAVQMATEYKVGGIVLEAPYLSVVQRASEFYPYVPVSLLLKDRFDSIDKIKQVHSPLLIFHGQLDGMIPIQHGQKLLEAANSPKKIVEFPNFGHVDIDLAEITKHLRLFIQEYHLSQP